MRPGCAVCGMNKSSPRHKPRMISRNGLPIGFWDQGHHPFRSRSPLNTLHADVDRLCSYGRGDPVPEEDEFGHTANVPEGVKPTMAVIDEWNSHKQHEDKYQMLMNAAALPRFKDKHFGVITGVS